MKHRAAAGQTRRIKRYANRKFYDTLESRYITLRGIAELAAAGYVVQIIENETGEDISAPILSQILADREEGGRTESESTLSELLERGGEALYEILRGCLEVPRGGIEGLERNVRRVFDPEEEGRLAPGVGRRVRDWFADAAPELEGFAERALHRGLRAFDIATRTDIEHLERRVEEVLARLDARRGAADDNGEGGDRSAQESS